MLSIVARPRLWLCLPVVALTALDLALTLAGQSAAYWGGDRLAAQEVNPIAREFLHIHPAALVAFVAAATSMICGVVVLTPLPLAAAIAFFAAFLHSLAAATWLVRQEAWGWGAACCTLIVAERLVAWSWRRAAFGDTSDASARSQVPHVAER